MAKPPWASFYGDLPLAIDRPPADMLELLDATLAARPDGEAIRYLDGSLSWSSVDQQSNALAAALAGMGVGAGDRLGIILQNVPHMAIAIIAAWKLGATPVPGNPMYKAGELARIFTDYRPSVVIGHDHHIAVVTEAAAMADLQHIPVIGVDARDHQSLNDARVLSPATPLPEAVLCFSRLIANHGDCPTPVRPDIGPETLGLILYTSGTTGQPKGAMVTHASLAFDARACNGWFGVDATSRILAIAPLFHITGFVLHLCTSIAAGCSQGLIYRFEPGVVVDMLRSYRPTSTIGAITAFNALMGYDGISADDFSSFRQIFSGGAPIAPALRETMRERLGIDIRPAYGMTETAGVTHAAPPGVDVPTDAATGALSIGIPISSTDAMIADEDGKPLPPGEVGEIRMRGPQVMVGYLDKPEDSAATLKDGWMCSGDVGFMDSDGWFYLVDRKKDMINASGFKVWPREVEDALYGHPAVREAAVVGFADAYRGESVRAFVSLKDGHDVDAAALIGHCREHLAAYKVPRLVDFLDELPKTVTGKIQRVALKSHD